MDITAKTDNRTTNAQISQIGLNVTCGREAGILVIFEVADGCGCSTTIPVSRAAEFMSIFRYDDDVNFDDGTYVESLKGKYVRLEFDRPEVFQGRLVAIGHIVDDEWYASDNQTRRENGNEE